jgi:hypothetical protein
MKREARLLLDKAIDSLILSVEHFNRADERGRTTTVLILLDHSFEMILKASILNRGGKIRERRARETIGFDACVRRALSDAKIRFLSSEQALTFQTINGLRDAAQHHLIDISEQQLYAHTQSGVTLFADILKAVFNQDLSSRLPARVLPISTVAPADMQTFFETELEEVKKLLRPGKRRRTEAYARLRPLAILDAAIRGEKLQPSSGELHAKGQELSKGKTWAEIFPGAASISFTTNGSGQPFNLRITKKEGIPVQLVPEGTPGASVVAVKRVNELDFYNLGRDQLAEKVGLSGPKTSAAIWCLKLQEDPECFKQLTIGQSKFNRYSQKAIDRIKEALINSPAEDMWKKYTREGVKKRR